jgi:halocyanin-like protein
MAEDTPVSRRTALRTAAALALAGPALAGCSSSGDESDDGDDGDGGDGSGTEFGGWMDDVSNFDGTVEDRTGTDQVTVMVGTEGNGSNWAFSPPAIRVSTGTTVRWEWTGEGGTHNVVAQGGAFDSGTAVSDADTTFERKLTEAQTYKYSCVPHEGAGMKGVVVVE